MAESHHIDVKEDDKSSEKIHDRAHRFYQKVINSLERVVLITNFILELPSAVLDQLSSEHKPQYALLSMLISFTVLLISIIDLVYKGMKERVCLMNRGLLPWFYYPYPNPKPFGTFGDIVGLVCAICQSFFASITYAFLSRHAQNPVRVSVWPIVFAFCLLYSRLYHAQRRPISNVRIPSRVDEFTLAELAAATNDFSLQNKIGTGSFGAVYRGKLPNGLEVAIKRQETLQKTKKFQEKDSAFGSELAFLSRLHHKHLAMLVGFCEDGDERLLVYEYMKNGALYDHLHDKNNTQKNSSVINSWRMRIKTALDAARGIEYLHNYAVPSIIHRDIKSSNILLDTNWTARVSDFGLSLMDPESERDYRPMKAAGTVGYIDPEYYGLNVLTAKSDVYGLGVVLLELLTGKRAIFKDDDNGSTPTSIVDFAVPKILSGELVKVLDPRVGPPELNDAEAVELVAYTALHCVNLEGKDRPTMIDIVANLERALTLCDGSHGTISSGTISIVSE